MKIRADPSNPSDPCSIELKKSPLKLEDSRAENGWRREEREANEPTIHPLNRERRAVLLARDRTGYAAISALLTRRQLGNGVRP